MFKALFNIIINLMATIVQLVCYIPNEAIKAELPDLSEKILEVSNTISTMFDGIYWALGLIPNSIITTLLFILTVEIAKHTVKISTHTLIKVWTILQKVKFW